MSAGIPGVGPEVEQMGHKPLPAQIYGLCLMVSASSPVVFKLLPDPEEFVKCLLCRAWQGSIDNGEGREGLRTRSYSLFLQPSGRKSLGIWSCVNSLWSHLLPFPCVLSTIIHCVHHPSGWHLSFLPKPSTDQMRANIYRGTVLGTLYVSSFDILTDLTPILKMEKPRCRKV